MYLVPFIIPVLIMYNSALNKYMYILILRNSDEKLPGILKNINQLFILFCC